MRILTYPTHASYKGKTHAELARYTQGWLHAHYQDIYDGVHLTIGGKFIAYIIDANTLKIKDFLEFETYEFNRDIEFADKSSITAIRKPNADADDYVICKCNGDTVFTGIFKEYEASSKNSEYKIKILQKEKLFDRFVFINDEDVISSTGIEDFIAETIRANWVSSGDSMLDKSYITVEALTHTKVYAKVSSIVSLTDGCFNLKTFLGNALENYGITIGFDFSSTALKIYIAKDTTEAMKINANDTDISEYTETYAVEALTKLLVQWNHKESGSSDTITETTSHEYYLLNDRSISTDKTNENRAKGSTKSMVIEAETEEEMYQSVQDEFSSNSYSHKIAFNLYMNSQLYDYIDLYIGRSCTIRTKDGIRTSLVTSQSLNNKSRFASIELGKLKVTLIDKIRSTS